MNPRLFVGVGDRCAVSRRSVAQIPVKVARIATELERHGFPSQHRTIKRNNRVSIRGPCSLGGPVLRSGKARQEAGDEAASHQHCGGLVCKLTSVWHSHSPVLSHSSFLLRWRQSGRLAVQGVPEILLHRLHVDFVDDTKV